MAKRPMNCPITVPELVAEPVEVLSKGGARQENENNCRDARSCVRNENRVGRINPRSELNISSVAELVEAPEPMQMHRY